VSSTVGRLAPSPTGVLHVGNARTLVAAWLSARSVGGKILLRIEDLLPGQPDKVATVLEDLAYLGLDWDPSPADICQCVPSDFDVQSIDNKSFWLQSQRSVAYDEVSHALIDAGLAYACVCTRKDIERALRAPHAEDKGAAYPGTCRNRFSDLADANRWEGARASRLGRRPIGAALRLRAPSDDLVFEDDIAGHQTANVARDNGDFVIRRKDGLSAYMFAVVLDDIAMGVTEVVRGDDLLDCTGQQLAVANAIAEHAPTPTLRAAAARNRPRLKHVPLVYGDDGRRLAKRNQSLHLRNLQRDGVPAEKVLAWIAASLGMPAVSDLALLTQAFDWDRVPRHGVRFGAADVAAMTAGGKYSPLIENAENTSE
jgi:glutamyl-tRNA synthetase